jgi:hypothetical protein
LHPAEPSTTVPVKPPVEAIHATNAVIVPPSSTKAHPPQPSAPERSHSSEREQQTPKRQLQRVLWQPPSTSLVTRDPSPPPPPPPNRNPGGTHRSKSSRPAAVDPMSPGGLNHLSTTSQHPLPSSALQGGRGPTSLQRIKEADGSQQPQQPLARVGPTYRVVIHQSPLFSITSITGTDAAASSAKTGSNTSTPRTSSPPPITVARNPLAGRPSPYSSPSRSVVENSGYHHSLPPRIPPLPATRPSPPITRCATPRNSSPAQSQQPNTLSFN